MLGRLLRKFASGLVEAPAKALVAAGISADLLTIVGLLIVAVAAWLIADGVIFAGGIVLAAGSVSDMLDGAVARVSKSASKRGAFLDSTTDRLSDALVFSSIWWYFLQHTSGALSLWGAALAVSALVLSFLVSYVKARAQGLGFSCEVGIAERPERIGLAAIGLVFDVLLWSLALLVVLSLVTVLQRFIYVWRQASPTT